MNDSKINLLCVIVMLLICLIVIGICHLANDAEWNNGYCSCGGKWEYQQAVGHRYETTYLYKCDKCGQIEEFYKVR